MTFRGQELRSVNIFLQEQAPALSGLVSGRYRGLMFVQPRRPRRKDCKPVFAALKFRVYDQDSVKGREISVS
jgi:hypothetical protein